MRMFDEHATVVGPDVLIEVEKRRGISRGQSGDVQVLQSESLLYHHAFVGLLYVADVDQIFVQSEGVLGRDLQLVLVRHELLELVLTLDLDLLLLRHVDPQWDERQQLKVLLTQKLFDVLDVFQVSRHKLDVHGLLVLQHNELPKPVCNRRVNLVFDDVGRHVLFHPREVADILDGLLQVVVVPQERLHAQLNGLAKPLGVHFHQVVVELDLVDVVGHPLM